MIDRTKGTKMADYKVRHQCDRTCADCEYYDFKIAFDEFGSYMLENFCAKNHYDYVGWYSEPCEDFKEA